MCLCARVQSNPKKSHLSAIKQIINSRPFVSKETHIDLLSYSDVNWACCMIDCKSISEICHFLGFALTLWFSMKKIPLHCLPSKPNIGH